MISVEVTACDEWEYPSTSNTLQLQLKGEYDSSRFFFVNENKPLPTYGNTERYWIDMVIDDHYGYSDKLFSVLISLSDSFGYCIKYLTVQLHGDKNNIKYKFDHYQFGQGIIISDDCSKRRFTKYKIWK